MFTQAQVSEFKIFFVVTEVLGFNYEADFSAQTCFFSSQAWNSQTVAQRNYLLFLNVLLWQHKNVCKQFCPATKNTFIPIIMTLTCYEMLLLDTIFLTAVLDNFCLNFTSTKSTESISSVNISQQQLNFSTRCNSVDEVPSSHGVFKSTRHL